MKKFMLLFIVSITMFSCRKNPDFAGVNNLRFDNEALNQVVLEKDNNKQKNMYQALTAKERFEIWTKKLDQLLASGKLNEKQAAFIKDLRNSLTPELFDPGSTAQASFNYISIKQNGIELFGVEDAFAILASLDPEQKALPIAGNDCGCSTSSDWCSGNSTCSNETCNSSLAGCGTFWLSSCDGLCRFPIVPN